MHRRIAALALLVTAGLSLAGCSGAHEPGSTRTEKTSAAATPVAAPPLRGTVSSPLDYVALGDSYSAGLGGGHVSGSCERSDEAYPELLAQDDTIDLTRFAACSGATTSDVLTKQLGALDPRVQFITMTIGGNDLDVSSLPVACAHGKTKQCTAAVDLSVSLLKTTLPGRLATTYQAIAKAAPNARILVADYPPFFDIPAGADLESDELSGAVAVDAAVVALDAAIEKAVTKQQKAGTDIRFVGISFDGHGVNSDEPWFVLTGASAYHPTADGYVRYAQTIHDSLG